MKREVLNENQKNGGCELKITARGFEPVRRRTEMAVPPIMTNTIQQQLIDAGIVPENCTRVIIDIGLDQILKVYYEAYGDKRILDLDLMSALKDVEVFKIEPALKNNG